MILEILSNTYVLPLVATIIGLLIVFAYDKFEKKQYTLGIYFRIGLVIYISCILTFYLANNNFFIFNSSSNTQSGGADSNQCYLPQPNEIKLKHEQFKTGVPTF